MLYEFNDNLENFVYWCNATGDLHHNAEYWIDNVVDLPNELQRAYNELWSEFYWANHYIAEFNGKYGIVIEAEYERDSDIPYEELICIVKNKAIELSNKYSEYDVIFGKDTAVWSDGSVNSTLDVFMPWNIDKEEFVKVAEYFDSMCYEYD